MVMMCPASPAGVIQRGTASSVVVICGPAGTAEGPRSFLLRSWCPRLRVLRRCCVRRQLRFFVCGGQLHHSCSVQLQAADLGGRRCRQPPVGVRGFGLRLSKLLWKILWKAWSLQLQQRTGRHVHCISRRLRRCWNRRPLSSCVFIRRCIRWRWRRNCGICLQHIPAGVHRIQITHIWHARHLCFRRCNFWRFPGDVCSGHWHQW